MSDPITLEQCASWVGLDRIRRVSIYYVRIPLKRPYSLSFSTLYNFNTILCMLETEESMLWGESTPLPGYGWEGPEYVWGRSLKAAEEIIGLRADEAFMKLYRISENTPFSMASLMGALEQKALYAYLDHAFAVRTIGMLLAETRESLSEEVTSLAESGFDTLKIKVGRDVNFDIQRIETVLDHLGAAQHLRIDANQGLDREGAVRLWDASNHSNVEYLEQPFPSQDWESVVRLLKLRPDVRICLDESVWLDDDLKTVEQLDGDVSVKLKLMKQASAMRILSMARRLQKSKVQVTLGNGVQGELGALAEIGLYRKLGLESTAECNGFAKQSTSIVKDYPLRISEGRIIHSQWDREITLTDDFQQRLVRSWQKPS